MQDVKIGIVVLVHNELPCIPRCLEALRAASWGSHRLWIVDNASSDGSAPAIRPTLGADEIWLDAGENLGYAGGNNIGIREALKWGAHYVLVVNPDCDVSRGFLPPLVEALETAPSVGAACPLVLNEGGDRIQSLGGVANLWTGRCRRLLFGRDLQIVKETQPLEVDWPHGTCMLLKRRFVEEVGLISEVFFLYYEDVELGLRAREKGWQILAVPTSRVRHRDTTGRGAANPLISFLGARNQTWIEAMYGTGPQWAVFLAFSVLLRWPLHVLLRLGKGYPRAALAVARGAWSGLRTSGRKRRGANRRHGLDGGARTGGHS
jgi:hypothetical protein